MDKQGVRVVSIRRVKRNPDAGTNVDFMSSQHKWMGKRFVQFLRQPDRNPGVLEVDHQNGEFIATYAGDRIGMPYRYPHAFGHGAQQLIADVMAERVIDRFKVIEIEEENGKLAIIAASLCNGLFLYCEKMSPIGQICERVMVGQMTGSLALVLALRDVVLERDEMRDASLLVE